MKKLIRITTLLIIGCLIFKNSSAQTPNLNELTNNPTTETGLLRKIMNGIYFTYYTPAYMSNKKPVFAMLRVDINWAGKVTDIRFSDSAESNFSKAYLESKDISDKILTFEKYAQLKSYLKTSVLIPVSYQPELPNGKGGVAYKHIQTFMNFNGVEFTGNVVIFPPVVISVASTGEM